MGRKRLIVVCDGTWVVRPIHELEPGVRMD